MNRTCLILICLIAAGSATAESKKEKSARETNERIAWFHTLPEPNADYGDLPTNYEKIVKEYFNGVLKDPYSAHYSFTKEPSKTFKGNYATRTVQYGYEVCIDVNAKNSYGAFTGNKPYWILIKDNTIIAIREEETDIIKRTTINPLFDKIDNLIRKSNLEFITAHCTDTYKAPSP